MFDYLTLNFSAHLDVVRGFMNHVSAFGHDLDGPMIVRFDEIFECFVAVVECADRSLEAEVHHDDRGDSDSEIWY